MVAPIVDQSSIIHGLAERWVARERAPGDRLELAARAGHALIVGKVGVAVVNPGGELAWRRVFGGRIGLIDAAIDAHGSHVAALVEGPRLELMRGAHGESISTVKVPDLACSVALSDRAERIAVGDRVGVLRFLDAAGKVKATVGVGHPIDFLGLTPHGDRAVAASTTGHVSLIGSKLKVERTGFVRAQVGRVWLDARGDRAFVLATGEGVMVHSFRTTSVVTLGLDRAVLDADSTAGGDAVALLTHDRMVAVLDAAARLIWQGDAPDGAVRMRANHDLGRLWFHDAEGMLHAFELLRGTEGARRAATLMKGPRRAYAREVIARPQPAPGGFTRVHVDPDAATGRFALVHRNGTVVVLAADGRELKRVEVSGGVRAVCFTDRGGLLAVASGKGVALLDPLLGWRASVALVAPVLGSAHGGAAVLACSSSEGDLSLVQADGVHPVTRLPGEAGAVSATRTVHGYFTFAALASGDVLGFAPLGMPSFHLDGGTGIAPVRLAAVGDRLLIGTASGKLRLVGLRGAVLAEARVGLPVASVQTVGDGFVVVDSRGELHRWTYTLDRGEGRQAPPGLFRPAVGPEGAACLVQHDRDTITVQSWGRRELARFDVSGTRVDLAATTFDRWALLTDSDLVLPPPPRPAYPE